MVNFFTAEQNSAIEDLKSLAIAMAKDASVDSYYVNKLINTVNRITGDIDLPVAKKVYSKMEREALKRD